MLHFKIILHPANYVLAQENLLSFDQVLAKFRVIGESTNEEEWGNHFARPGN